MGEYVEMALSGVVCQMCGEFMGEDVGYPMTCNDCHEEMMKWEVEKENEQK
ncbi:MULTISPECIES: hypothetical protein [unclassified Sporosarcina]|uniref:hypothetical protein n=1 Tax=unclassified Sporosarcina TaxID=2647733 RepID=UPI0018DB6E57|nr:MULTISPECIES: hypothetical protein [unclassified Sporosarcina]